MPVDIAIFLRNLDMGGAERVSLNLARGFAENGFNVNIVTYNKKNVFKQEIPNEIKTIDLESSNFIFQVLNLAKYLKEEKPKILLSGTHYANEKAILAKLVSRTRTKVFVIEHTNPYLEAKNVRTSRFAPITSHVLYRFADGIVAVSKGVAKDLSEIIKISPKKIKVIYEPVITPEFLKESQEKVNCPSFGKKQPIIIAAGRIAKQKDFSTLLRAFAKIRKIRKAQLVLLGEGGEKKNLLKLAKELDIEKDLTMPGWVSNPHAYIAKSDILVSSSLWEGMSCVLVEALALGIPVVATDCPSGPREILKNGKYGYLVPVGNSNAIANSILNILNGKKKKVDKGWLEQFKRENTIRQYLELFGIKKTEIDFR